MKLTDIEIKNFQDTNHAYIFFPDSRITCLIGAGSNGKSTIFKAIEWVLWSS